MTAVELKLSGDRKVAGLIRRRRGKDDVKVLNSFGLPAGASCPGMTPFCGKCYAASLERCYTSAARLVAGNLEALEACGDDVDELANVLGPMVVRFIDAAQDKGAPLVFRIHWDGDFYSRAYAQAWAKVITLCPEVQFWAYTRSFGDPVDVVDILAGIPNLALYLSVDRWNLDAARPVLAAHPGVLVAYCADTQADAANLAVELGRPKAAPCPENIGRLPLVVAQDGRRCSPVEVGDDAQGACVACGLCVYGRRDVGFATTKR